MGKDAAGNTSRAVTDTTDGSTVTIDTTAPTFTTVKISSNNTNTSYAKEGDTITLTAKANEALSDAPTFSSFTIGATSVTPSVFTEDTDQTTTNTYVALHLLSPQLKYLQITQTPTTQRKATLLH